MAFRTMDLLSGARRLQISNASPSRAAQVAGNTSRASASILRDLFVCPPGFVMEQPQRSGAARCRELGYLPPAAVAPARMLREFLRGEVRIGDERHEFRQNAASCASTVGVAELVIGDVARDRPWARECGRRTLRQDA